MTIASFRSPGARELRAAAILFIPYMLFVCTLVPLFLLHGGHRYAILGRNPYCRLPATSPNLPPFSNTTSPRVVLHISDLHVSDVVGSPAKRNLALFRASALPRWASQASAIAVTGDLVHAIVRNPYPLGTRSEQSRSEWRWLDAFAADVNTSVAWLPAHGNHDSFGGKVARHAEAISLSPLVCPAKTGGEGDAVARFSSCVEDEKLTLLALDCTLPSPLNRPLNFFGDARAAAMQLERYLDESEGGSGKQDLIIAFGHYPSAVMTVGKAIHNAATRTTPDGGLERPRFAAFLSGHLHTLKGLAQNGLQAVSRSGAFELQLTDMVETGAYRVLAFDHGFLSFKDFSVLEAESRQLADEIIVTNPPRAGFCSVGAGSAALRSSHIRLVGPTGMSSAELDVQIDGKLLGRVTQITPSCEEKSENSRSNGTAKCVPTFGVPWDASKYDDGKLHSLSIHTAGGQSKPYIFSLDGSPEWRLKSRAKSLVSALFSLSDFETMASALCTIGFCWCFLFSLPGLMSRQATSLALCSLSAILKFGPFVVGENLTSTDTGLGAVGLRYIRLPSAVHRAGVDVPYMMSVTVLYGILIPVGFLDALVSTRLARDILDSRVAGVFALLLLLRSSSWCFEILGAHGIRAGLLSPSCMPLFVVVLYSILTSFRKLGKRRE